jgi:hypothetical protein
MIVGVIGAKKGGISKYQLVSDTFLELKIRIEAETRHEIYTQTFSLNGLYVD